ncbi:MAG: SAM-dependent methyltransferase [Dysgonamonadaceae bacterium]|jgi:hypothetical protein|nr:SAM-dependent methyltransferase [Dysgonamonadaceae bacterium]
MLSPEDKQFIKEHLSDDVRRLALKTSSFFPPDANSKFILQQIAGRQQIRHKIPTWYQLDDIVYPQRLSLEQCSSEATAKYKASLLSGDSFADLTGGFGVDTAFISQKFTFSDYIEKQSELAEIAKHNFSVLSLKTGVHNEDGKDYLQQMKHVDWIYLDPARRSDSGGKTVLIEDCDPNLLDIQDLLMKNADGVLLKLSPMLDIRAALTVLKNVQEIHVVSVENECKEILFLLQKDIQGDAPVVCVNIDKYGEYQSVIFHLADEKNSVISYTDKIGAYIYEPNVSILKAGYFKGTAFRYNLNKLHPDSHLYTSSELVTDFPGRIFLTESVFSPNKKEMAQALSDINQANISVRNFPFSVAELRKKWKIKEGGEIYLFATTLANGSYRIIKARKLTFP